MAGQLQRLPVVLASGGDVPSTAEGIRPTQHQFQPDRLTQQAGRGEAVQLALDVPDRVLVREARHGLAGRQHAVADSLVGE